MRISALTFCTLLASTALVSWSEAAIAQSMSVASLPPYQYVVDDNSIDLTTGQIRIEAEDISVGPAETPLAFFRTALTSAQTHNFALGIKGDPASSLSVVIGNRTYGFTKSGTNWVPSKANGTQLKTVSGSLTFVDRDGTKVTFSPTRQQWLEYNTSNYFPIGFPLYVGSKITFPDGRVQTLNYRTYVISSGTGTARRWNEYFRLRSVVDSRGYMLQFEYDTDSTSPIGYAWISINGVTAINLAVDYCAPTADHCGTMTARGRSATRIRCRPDRHSSSPIRLGGQPQSHLRRVL